MVSERAIKISHTVLFGLVLVASIISLAISASLVAHYNGEGYPPVHSGSYRDRIRILLVASVWTTAFGTLLIVGFQVMGRSPFFGIVTHFFPVLVGFLLFVIGSAALTALTDKIDCGRASDAFSRCGVVKGLVVISWIDTILLLITLIFITVLGFMAHRGYGARKSTLYVE